MTNNSASPTAVWTIRWATLQDLGNIQQYIAKHWSAGHLLARDAAFLRWQFASATPDQLQIVLAERENLIGGILGVIDADWVASQQRGSGAWLSTWSVAPEFRQFGLALRLLDFVKQQGYALIGTVGANPAALQLYRLLKYQIIPVMPRSLRLFSYDGLLAVLEHFPKIDLAAYQDFWKERERPVDEISAGLTPQAPTSELLSQWDELWKHQLASQYLSLERNAAYICRRYLEHPVFDYQVFFSTTTNGSPTGIGVYRLAKIEPSSRTMMRVVEFLAVDDAAYVQLGSQLLAAAKQGNCVYADFSCTLESSHQNLPGFTKEQPGDAVLPKRLAPAEFGKTTTSACWQVFKPNGNSPLADSAVYLTSGDCDQDRPN